MPSILNKRIKDPRSWYATYTVAKRNPEKIILNGIRTHDRRYDTDVQYRGHGFESRSSLNFIQAFFLQLLKLHTYCEDLSCILSLIRGSNIGFLYSYSFIIPHGYITNSQNDQLPVGLIA